jgi:hypothetical protein
MPPHAHLDTVRAVVSQTIGRAAMPSGETRLLCSLKLARFPPNTGLQPFSRIEAVNGVRISERLIAEVRLVITPPSPTRGGRADLVFPRERFDAISGGARRRGSAVHCGSGSIWTGGALGGGRAGHAAARSFGHIGVFDPGGDERIAAELRSRWVGATCNMRQSARR